MDKLVKIQNLLITVKRNLCSVASKAQNDKISISLTKVNTAINYLNELKRLLEDEQRKSS